MWFKKWLRWTFRLGILAFLLLNSIAIMQAWNFTHFSTESVRKTKDPKQLSLQEKITVLFTGVKNPRPVNLKKPDWKYQTIKLDGELQLEAWLSPIPKARGTVILFHGFSGEKSSLLHKAKEFHTWGYRTLVVDFRGSGGSTGNNTTIGYKEARDVQAAFRWATLQYPEEPIYLLGISMGAVAIMRALDQEMVDPVGGILECPFGSMRATCLARFRNMKVPSFPMADLLVFWGGTLNGFWAHGHDPEQYARRIHCPVLLLYGEKDDKVSLQETQTIFNNLQGPKTLRIYPKSGHESYLNDHPQEWRKDVSSFLKLTSKVSS